MTHKQFRPFSADDLFDRLRTFRSSTWFAKPPGAGAVPCALHGYENTALDIVSCTCCKAKLSCIVPTSATAAELMVVGTRFAARLPEAHEAHCPWRLQTCDATLAQFPAELPDRVRKDFDERTRALEALFQRLGRRPTVPPRLLGASLLRGEDRRAQLMQVTGSQGPWEDKALSRLLALVGWEPHDDGASLRCPCCEARCILSTISTPIGSLSAATSAPKAPAQPASTPQKAPPPTTAAASAPAPVHEAPVPQQPPPLPASTSSTPPLLGAWGQAAQMPFGFGTFGTPLPLRPPPSDTPFRSKPAFGSPAPAAVFGSAARSTAADAATHASPGPFGAPQPSPFAAPRPKAVPDVPQPAASTPKPAPGGWASTLSLSIAGGVSPSPRGLDVPRWVAAQVEGTQGDAGPSSTPLNAALGTKRPRDEEPAASCPPELQQQQQQQQRVETTAAEVQPAKKATLRSSEAVSLRVALSGDNEMDPVGSHRPWCFWVNNNGGPFCGWSFTLDTLARER